MARAAWSLVNGKTLVEGERDQVIGLRRKKDELVLGQRYRAAGTNGFGRVSRVNWILEDVIVGTDGLRYARLVQVDDPRERKLVSVNALLDRRLFEPS